MERNLQLDGTRRAADVTYACTCHPTQTVEDKFFNLSMGFQIGMANCVITKDSASNFERLYRILAEKGVPLPPNPIWNSKRLYSKAGNNLRPADWGEYVTTGGRSVVRTERMTWNDIDIAYTMIVSLAASKSEGNGPR